MLVGIACSSGTLKEPPVPSIDLSTPEAAIKSYWRVCDWKVERQNYFYSKYKNIFNQERSLKENISFKFFQEDIIKKFIIPSNEYFSKRNYKYSKDIIEMKKETDTRVVAIVKIKNITPIPDNAEKTEYSMKEREKGRLYKVVLEKNQNNEWKIAAIYNYYEFNNTWSLYTGEFKPDVPTYGYLPIE